MTDKTRIENGLNIRRPRKKGNITNEKRIQTCITKFDSGSFTRLQFLRAVSHSISTHMDALQVIDDNDHSDNDDENQSQQSDASTISAAEAASTSDNSHASAADDVCEVCLVSSRARVA